MTRNVKYQVNGYIKECPKCLNNTDMTIHSQQVSEDSCDVWATCAKCGYDPTESNTLNRIDDVYGGCDDDNARDAIDHTWNELIEMMNTT